jgi:para-aminobenzoate synthetase / 4-amino-4-deoxychorismate lyase
MLTRRPANRRSGVFETVLVVGGEPVELGGHLDRLAASIEVLYGAKLPGEAHDRVAATAAEEDRGRLRLTATPTQPDRGWNPSGGIELEIEVTALDPILVFPPADRGAPLVTTDLTGGLGQHKWTERPGLDRTGDDAGPLIADGPELLEAGWANLFAVSDGVLRTPPVDGRILPGVARAAVLEIAADEGLETREQPLCREDLLGAEEVFLTNSIRGIEAATSLDSAPLPGAGSLTRRLAPALRQRWGLPSDLAPLGASAAAPKPGQPAR